MTKLVNCEAHTEIRSLIKEQGDYARDEQASIVSSEADIELKADDSIVTRVDHEVSDKLISGLKKITGYDVLSEEGKDQLTQIQQAAKQNKPIWVVDPIDGTSSYTKGKDEYAVNVGLVAPVDGEMKPVLGFVYYPGQQLFLYTDMQGKAVQWNTESDSYKLCTHHQRLSIRTPSKLAIGYKDIGNKHPLHEYQLEESKHTGPFRAAKVIIGECDASVMNSPTSIWDTAGIQAVAEAAGLHFMPIDNESFLNDPMYYGGSKERYYGDDPSKLANPPYMCVSAHLLSQIHRPLPQHVAGGVSR